MEGQEIEIAGFGKTQIYNTPAEYIKARSSSLTPQITNATENLRWWRPILDSDIYNKGGRFDNYKGYIAVCINARGINIPKARIELHVKQPNSRTGQPDKEIFTHPFFDLLDKPNIYQQGFKMLMWNTIGNLDIWGNSYWYTPRDIFGRPAGLYLLPSRYCVPTYTTDFKNIATIKYFYGRESVEYDYQKEIIHFKMPNMDTNLLGRSTLSLFHFAPELHYYINKYFRNYFLNDATPGTVYTTEQQLNQEVYDRTSQNIFDRHQGADNAYNPILLEGGVKLATSSNNPREADFVKSKAAIRDEVCETFSVPKAVIGVTEDVNRANAMTQIQMWLENTVSPFADIVFVDRLTRFVKDNYDERLFIRFNYTFRGDRKLQNDTIQMYSDTGIATKNEMRLLAPDAFEPYPDPEADKLSFGPPIKSAPKNNQEDNTPANKKDTQDNQDNNENS